MGISWERHGMQQFANWKNISFNDGKSSTYRSVMASMAMLVYRRVPQKWMVTKHDHRRVSTHPEIWLRGIGISGMMHWRKIPTFAACAPKCVLWTTNQPTQMMDKPTSEQKLIELLFRSRPATKGSARGFPTLWLAPALNKGGDFPTY
jgi:hypothetical protein